MMATININPSTYNNNNNNNNIMRPPFIPSSSHFNNYLAPPPNHYIISPNYNYNTTNNNLFQVHNQYNNNMNISSSWLNDDNNSNNNVLQEDQLQLPFHESLSQLLLSGLFMGEEGKKMENWEQQIGLQQHFSLVEQLKQENSLNSYNNNNHSNNNVYSTNNDQEIKLVGKSTNWSPHQSISISSPQSCVSTTFVPISDHSSECNSTATGGALKKPKVQPSSSRSTIKVRKEKLGDRITSLHQLVSPFGKTDTASVLLEAIGYIRFLHGQIEALSHPYLTNEAARNKRQHIVEGERKCIFPEDPGQLLHENCLKRKGGPDQDSYEEVKDLRSKGLCLVPLSCTINVGTDNGADYWAPAIGGGGFR